MLHFLNKLHVVKDNLFPTPPLFRLIQQESQTPWQEMYRVFNMGHRFELFTNAHTAAEIIDICKDFKLEAQVIGYVEPAEHKKLTISGNHGVFEYA